jgi:hypothetical protein
MLLKGSDTAVSCCLLGTQKERRTRESAEPGQRHERCELENTQWKGKHEVEASMTEEGGGSLCCCCRRRSCSRRRWDECGFDQLHDQLCGLVIGTLCHIHNSGVPVPIPFGEIEW